MLKIFSIYCQFVICGPFFSKQVFEGIFFLYTAIAERVELSEKTYLPALLNFLPQVPITHPILIATTLGMIGKFYYLSTWFIFIFKN